MILSVAARESKFRVGLRSCPCRKRLLVKITTSFSPSPLPALIESEFCKRAARPDVDILDYLNCDRVCSRCGKTDFIGLFFRRLVDAYDKPVFDYGAAKLRPDAPPRRLETLPPSE